MRRSGSSSCMLRPRNSNEGIDKSERLSVTVLNKEQLPPYTAERFFMLSEIREHGHSTHFIADLRDLDDMTRQTEDTVSLGDLSNSDAESFAPFIVLYLLWGPEGGSSVSSFTEGILVPTMKKIQSRIDIETWEERERRTRDLPLSATPSRLRDDGEGDDDMGSNNRAEGSTCGSFESRKSRVYVVVDRVTPSSVSEIGVDNPSKVEAERSRKFQVEVTLAEQLARNVASHKLLRSICEGITVGIANHERAAPGLEACLDAVHVGSRDRRRIDSDSTSLIGMVAPSPGDLLGLEKEKNADAAENVLQTRVSTEWNGKGNLRTFAASAHSMWRVDHGLPPQEPESQSPMKRRRRGRNLGPLNGGFEGLGFRIFDLIANAIAFFLFVFYFYKGVFGDSLET